MGVYNKTYNFEVIDFDKELSKNRPVFTKEMFGEDAWLPTDKLKIDIKVQRELQETHVQKLLRKFDPAAFGRISVAKREDGYYYVQDGQHRLEMAKRLFLDEVPCVITNLESVRDEGRAFIKINENSAKVTGIDKYRIGVSSEITEYLRVKECCDYAGLRIGSGPNYVNCVSAIYRCVNSATLLSSIEYNMQSTKYALKILKDSFGVEGINQVTVQGMFIFTKAYIMGDIIDMLTVIERLSKCNIKELIETAYEMKNNGRGKVYSYAAYLFVNEYNRNLKSNRKLPMLIEM